MKKQLTALILLTAILASSCKVVGTLYPITQDENEFVFKKELIGKWEDRKDLSGYYTVDTISGKDGKLYEIESVFNNKEKNTVDTNRYRAILVSISGRYYLDCWADPDWECNFSDDSYKDLLIARHFIFRLSFPGTDEIELTSPDSEELIKLIDQKKIALHYANMKKDDYLILDKPAILQKGLAATEIFPALYKEKNILHKLK